MKGEVSWTHEEGYVGTTGAGKRVNIYHESSPSPREMVAAVVRPTDEARFVIVHSADGYTTNLPLSDCLVREVILADQLFGEPLPF